MRYPVQKFIELVIQAGMDVEGDEESGYGFSIPGDYEKIGVEIADGKLSLYHPCQGANLSIYPEWPVLEKILGLLDVIDLLSDSLSISLRLHFIRVLLKEANAVAADPRRFRA